MIGKRYMQLLFYFTLGLYSASANENCLKIEPYIRESHKNVIAKDYPYWYGTAQAEKETNCKWRISADGHGSVGYFQLTPKFLDPVLRPLYPDYDKPYSVQHFYASAYLMRNLIFSSPEKKLWIAYQRYNGGDWVIKECKKAGTTDWKDCKAHCKRKDVCVLKVGNKCRQYKNACEINYEYSLKIFNLAKKYRAGDDRFSYW